MSADRFQAEVMDEHRQELERLYPTIAATWPQEKQMSADLLKVNVNEHTEKKANLTYLSWAWAWAEVLKFDPMAVWEVVEYSDGQCPLPFMLMPDKTAMVKTLVTIKGLTRSCLLPVMDHKNKAIPEPNAFQINTAIMRCMTKAVSMHGLGLYIYAGEDLPEGEEAPVTAVAKSFRSSATMGVFETLLTDRQNAVLDSSIYIVERCEANDIISAYDEANRYLDDERVALAGKLPSHVRSALKKYGESLKPKKEAVTA